jgi:hypothetical protein
VLPAGAPWAPISLQAAAAAVNLLFILQRLQLCSMDNNNNNNTTTTTFWRRAILA